MSSTNHQLYLPEFVHITRQPNSVLIQRRWITWRYVFASFFLVFLPVVFVYMSTDTIKGPGNWLMLVVVVPWYLFVLYFAATKLVNRSYIMVNEDVVDITHKPLPYARNLTVPSNTISRLQIEQKQYKGRGRRRYYEISALLNDGTTKPLLNYIEIESQAAFIKYEIENLLNQFSKR